MCYGRQEQSSESDVSISKVAHELGISKATLLDYRSIDSLIPSLQRLMKEGDIGTYTAIYLAHLPKKDQRLIADKLVQALADNEITVRQVRALRDELLRAVALSRLVSVGGLLGARGEGEDRVTPPAWGQFRR